MSRPRFPLLVGLGFGLLSLAGCPSAGDTEPEPASFRVGSGENPWAEDLDAAFADLPEALQEMAEEVPEGALAGTFATRAVSATIVDTVVRGTHRGGGVNYRLIERTFDEEERLYHQTQTLCGGFNFEVAGVGTDVGEGVYRLVPPSEEETVRSDDATGAFLSEGHVQRWGLHDFPLDEALPPDIASAEEEPWPSRIYDMDEDDHPGITVYFEGDLGSGEGGIEGEVYAIQRKTVATNGVTVSPDYVVGRVFTTWESLALGADPPLVEAFYDGSADPHPDPDESWFEELRLEEGAGCEEVLALVEEGAFAEERAPWLEE